MKKKNKKFVGDEKRTKKISKNKSQSSLCDEEYRQMNLASFQKDFKILVGNYKDVGEDTEAGK